MNLLPIKFIFLFTLFALDARANDSLVEPTASVKLITQNVYGFADFTTTIGNTVMIFSPSSVAVAVPEPPKEDTTTPQSPLSTIETKPIADTPPKVEITPSKTVAEPSSKQQVVSVVSSVVQVVEEPPTGATKKPKKKKPKTTTTTVNPVPFEVKAITAVTPEPPKIVMPAKPVEVVTEKKKDDGRFIVESVKAVEAVTEFQESAEPEDDDEIILQDGNAISEPEYDFLSRQPTEFVEETYRVVNLKPSVIKKPKISAKTTSKNADVIHPTGLVTKSGGTVVNNGLTTVHETSVIGTYINGKYAQVLQSTSSIINTGSKPKIQPSSTLRILKTAAPSFNKTPKYVSNEEENEGPTVRTIRKPGQAPNSFKNRIQNRKDSFVSEEIVTPSPVTPAGKKASSRRNGFGKAKSPTRPTSKSVEVATIAAEPVTGTYVSRRNKSTRKAFQPTSVQQVVAQTQDTGINKKFKPKISPSNIDGNDQGSTSLYKFKLNRTPGRWQYKTTPKPRVTIRKHGSAAGEKDAYEVLAVTPSIENVGNDIDKSKTDLDVDLDGSGSVNGDVLDDVETGAGDNRIEKKLPIETIRVEISTPADFSDTYYEIATIKSPYTFQVGQNKNTRYITVTSTFEKTIDPEPTATSILTEPLTENILAPTSHLDKEHNLLETSIATLPPLHLGDDQATPPLETVTETFSTTQQLLKTHILPVVREGTNTTSYTLIQTYHVTRLVTATKTLPPTELYQFVPSKTLNEFNSKLDEAGSELHLELEFGDDNEHDDEDGPKRVALPEDLDLANIGSDFDVSEVDKMKIPRPQRPKKTTQKPKIEPKPEDKNLLGLTPEQLAILRLLNPAAVPNIITTSKPVIKVETVYESHVLPILNGQSTIFSTISRPIATVTKTDYEFGTSILPAVTQQPINPLLLQTQQIPQYQLQSTPVVAQQIVTQTDSKVLKLTFGARTAYTTLYNTRVVPTMVTSYVTQSIAVQPTAFPGFYPAPYPPFPFVG